MIIAELRNEKLVVGFDWARYYKFLHFLRIGFFVVSLVALQQLSLVNLIIMIMFELLGLFYIIGVQIKFKVIGWFSFFQRVWTHCSFAFTLLMVGIFTFGSEANPGEQAFLLLMFLMLAISENLFLIANLVKVLGKTIINRLSKKKTNQKPKSNLFVEKDEIVEKKELKFVKGKTKTKKKNKKKRDTNKDDENLENDEGFIRQSRFLQKRIKNPAIQKNELNWKKNNNEINIKIGKKKFTPFDRYWRWKKRNLTLNLKGSSTKQLTEKVKKEFSPPEKKRNEIRSLQNFAFGMGEIRKRTYSVSLLLYRTM